MNPSRDLCQKVAAIDPNSRLGYYDGQWCVVKLYRAKDLDRCESSPDPWNNRGPIFSKNGTRTPDWDLIERVPCNVSEVSSSLIQSWKVLDTLRDWVTDIRDSQYLALVKLAQNADKEIEDQATKMTDYACWHAQHALKVGEQGSNPILAKKFLPKKQERDNKNRYWQELEMLEFKWRQEGWRPPHERAIHE